MSGISPDLDEVRGQLRDPDKYEGTRLVERVTTRASAGQTAY